MIGAQPVGEFSDFIDWGFGAGGHFVWNLERSGALGVRVDGGFVNYGRERQRVCLSTTVGCRIQVDLTTTNDIAFASIGPQIALPRGAVQPYANASVGFAYFSTSSSVEGVDDNDDEFNTTNFDDLTFAWQAGAGLRVPVSMGACPSSSTSARATTRTAASSTSAKTTSSINPMARSRSHRNEATPTS